MPWLAARYGWWAAATVMRSTTLLADSCRIRQLLLADVLREESRRDIIRFSDGVHIALTSKSSRLFAHL
jgi:hypothetical protein